MTILKIPQAYFAALQRRHLDPASPFERLSYMFGKSYVDGDGQTHVLVSAPPIQLSDDCFVRQSGANVALHDDVRDGVWLRFARSDEDTIIDIHDHWFSPGGTRFSSVDDSDDRARATYLFGAFTDMLRNDANIGRPRPLRTVSIVLDKSSLDAREIDEHGAFHPIDRVELIGEAPRRLIPNSVRPANVIDCESMLRQRDFITPDHARFLASSTVGIIGCGGLGSVLAEALFRIGIRHFILFDDDKLATHNLNRWQGGRPGDVGRNKARLLAGHLRRFGCGQEVHATAAPFSILDAEAEPMLRGCDMLIGCVDNDVARYLINRASIQYRIPYFDAGVNIRTKDAVDFESRFFAVIPGVSACAECTAYELLDFEAIETEMTDPITSAERLRAGYVSDQPALLAAASAYPLNLRSASTLVTELLNWVCGYRPWATCVLENWQQGLHQRSDRGNHPEAPSPGCSTCTYLLGAADQVPLPRPRASAESTASLLEAAKLLRTGVFVQ